MMLFELIFIFVFRYFFECFKIFDFICFYNFYSELESLLNLIVRDFKEMLKFFVCLLINGRYVLCSLRYFIEIL